MDSNHSRLTLLQNPAASPHGRIYVQDSDGKYGLAGIPPNHPTGQPITEGRFYVREGDGRDPRVEYLYHTYIFNGKRDDRLSIPICLGTVFLSVYGKCIAANEKTGLICVDWTGAAKTLLEKNQRIIKISKVAQLDREQGEVKMLSDKVHRVALLPADMRIPVGPGQEFLKVPLPGISTPEHFTATFRNDLKPILLVSSIAATLCMADRNRPTVREQMLLKMGMRLEEFGNTPTP